MSEIQYLEINDVTRIIKVPTNLLLGVMEDKDVERVYFKCKKIVGDNVDLSKHQLYVKYVNALDNSGKNFDVKTPGIYHCEDVVDHGDYITFSWLLSGNVFKKGGFVAFSVLASDGETTRWNTFPAIGTVLITIPGGLQEVEERYPDIITQLLNRMDEVEAMATPEAMQGYVNTYLAQHPAEIDPELLDPKKCAPANVVGQLKADMVNGAFLQLIDLTESNIRNGYVQANGEINSISKYAHTINSIILKPMSRLFLTSKGYQNDVAVISENIKGDNIAKPLITSLDGTLRVYTYTNNSNYDVDLCLSFFNDNTASAYIINSVETANFYFNYIKNNTIIKITDKIYPIRNGGYYINASGSKVALTSYFYSEPIELKKNDIVTLTSQDPSGSVIARMCLSDKHGNIISVLSLGTNEITTFTYTATKDCYIVLCTLKSNKDFYIIRERISIPTYYINQTENSKDVYTTTSMFNDIAVCGDSYTAGSIYKGDTLLGDNTKTRWGTVLSRLTGANVTTYASGGADTLTYQTRKECLPNILNNNPHELYILCLGINDKERVTLGSLSDIKEDYTQNENTFYGNYGKIISQIKEHAPNAKILISKVFIVTYVDGAYYEFSNKAIEEIANYFNIPFIDTKDEPFFSSDYFETSMVKGHPVAPTYSGIAVGMNKLISKCIEKNPNYFNDYYPVN